MNSAKSFQQSAAPRLNTPDPSASRFTISCLTSQDYTKPHFTYELRYLLSMMYFSSIVITALLNAYIGVAGPASQRETRQETLCSGLEDKPLCCAVDVLGVASLNCQARKLCRSLPGHFCSDKEAA